MAEPERKPTTTADDWQRRYVDGDTPWDSGRVDRELQRLIESGDTDAPNVGTRAIDLGCGTGINAVYLAEQGFEVTAVDLAPQALERAQLRVVERAIVGSFALGAVQPRFVLGDVTQLDDVAGPFDFVFDRGCYHCVRRAGLLGGYLATLRRLTTTGSRILILAGNPDAGEAGGPPKVTAAELAADFEKFCRIERLEAMRFQEADGSDGPLGWSLLMTRR